MAVGFVGECCWRVEALLAPGGHHDWGATSLSGCQWPLERRLPRVWAQDVDTNGCGRGGIAEGVAAMSFLAAVQLVRYRYHVSVNA